MQTSRQTHLRQARGALVDAVLASSPGGSRRSDASLQAPILARHRNEKREENLHSGHFEPLLVLIRFVESGHGGQRRAHKAPGGGAGWVAGAAPSAAVLVGARVVPGGATTPLPLAMT